MAIYNINNDFLEVSTFLQGKFAFPCAGKGTCGKCKVKITGSASPMTDAERTFLTQTEIDSGIRLACFTTILGVATVETFNATQDILGLKKTIPSLDATLTTVCAIDIGTTTVACVIYDSTTGECLAEVLESNVQAAYGADVISRIESATENGVEVLANAIQGQLTKIYNSCKKLAGVDKIDKTVITGNTTMLHLLEGLDPVSLGVSPFKTVSLFGYNTKFLEAYLPRCVSAYVGADLLCSALSSGMVHKDEISLLVDIGTNGEMCIYKNNKLVVASTAAGPAFEGCGLSCGSPAVDGAITGIVTNGEDFTIKHIGSDINTVCGSGIVSVVSTFKDLEILDETGRLTDESHPNLGYYQDDTYYIKNSNVRITGEDIRQVQLAKAAICAGILTLLDETNTNINDVSSLYIAGGFGYHLNIKEACNIGLIPLELLSKVKIIGNAALEGALKIALNYAELPEIYTEVNLSTSKTFSNNYIECMMFE